MIARPHKIFLLVVGLLTAASALADDATFYESLDEVVVGRVFLSPEERARLDVRRGQAPVATGPAQAGPSPHKADRKDAAGYIVSSSGQTRVWTNGGFVSGRSATSVRFPGEVRVTRKPAAESGDSGDGR